MLRYQKLEITGTCKLTPKAICILTKVVCTSAPNLVVVILASRGIIRYHADKLVINTHTHTYTDRHTKAITISKGQNWPQIKTNHMPFWNTVGKYKSICAFLTQNNNTGNCIMHIMINVGSTPMLILFLNQLHWYTWLIFYLAYRFWRTVLCMASC